jgi:CHAD domain-containing protein
MLPAAPTTQSKKSGLAYWAARVLEECDKAAVDFAADPVHDLRVAIRRCRSMADGFLSVDPDRAWKQMKRLAKPLFSALGDLRDTQVMLEWVAKLSPADDALGADLEAALRAKEGHLKAAAQEALASFDRHRWSELTSHLATRTGAVPLEGAVFQHLALERWLEARELHRRALRNRSGLAWHQLRIGIKRLRYTAENFLPQRHQKWSKDLRELQDALGEVHDLDVLRAIIHRHPGVPADDRSPWLKRIAEERHKRLQLYRSKMTGRHSLWELWRRELPSGTALEDAALEKLRTWAVFLDPDIAHSALVNQLSLALYDGLSQCGIFKPTAHHRHVLQAAAWLHEVGRSKDGHHQRDKGHRKHGQRLVIKLHPPLGWSEQDMRWLAALVRFHGGGLPSRGDSAFVGLDPKQRAELLRLMGVLRLANSFDEAHNGTVRDLTVVRKDGAVMLSCQGMQTMSRAAERVARARYLLETVCGRPILLQFRRARASRKAKSGLVGGTGRSRLVSR